MNNGEEMVPKKYNKAQEDRMMKVLMERIEKEERIAVIEWYISVFFLSLIMVGLGSIIGKIFL